MRGGRRSAALRRAGRSAAALAALLMVACGQLPPPAAPPPEPEAAASPPPPAPLQPLARQPATPFDAPRSLVPQARYDLALGRTEDEMPPEDGVPGDPPPGEVFQRGGASWYGLQFHQRRTANGELFDMGAFTAAHKTLPFHTRVCVRSLVNGREVLVRINDRGPFAAGRVIDLSRAAAEAIGMIDLGIKQVALTLIGAEEGRCDGRVVAAADREADTVRAAVSAPAATAKPARSAAAPKRSARREAPARR